MFTHENCKFSGIHYTRRMKWIIASDLHGSAYYCRKLFEKFEEERADKILLLGDLLYHGPRNDLPKEYNPKAVISMLNSHAEQLVCVRGNCDAEVDQMVLDFPMMADYAVLDCGKASIYATHGHVYNEENPLKFSKGNIMICGHFHVPCIHIHENFIYMNDGSLSLPKENSFHSFMTFDGKDFLWHDLETGEIKMRHTI